MSETNETGAPAKKGRKGCLIVVGAVVLLIVIAAIAGPETKTVAVDSETSGLAKATANVPAIEVTAKQLQQAYEANEAAAQQQYGKKPLRVSGKIINIQLDFADKPFVVLEGTNEFLGPQASLDDESQPKATNLTKGQKISLSCAGVSEVVGVPQLADCHID